MVAVFAIFVGGQITEGVILVPYWKSLSSQNFYSFYESFGPLIGRFYTVLTLIAAFIPIVLCLYCWRTKHVAFRDALISSIFALLFIAAFYIYFKGANEQFYAATMSAAELSNELRTWSLWHWGRVVMECSSLYFLMRALQLLE